MVIDFLPFEQLYMGLNRRACFLTAHSLRTLSRQAHEPSAFWEVVVTCMGQMPAPQYKEVVLT